MDKIKKVYIDSRYKTSDVYLIMFLNLKLKKDLTDPVTQYAI